MRGDLGRWAREVPGGRRALAAAFWPGPLTLILPRAADVGDAVTGGQDSVGAARAVASGRARAARRVRRGGGDGIAAPSANRFGHVSPTTAQHVADDLGERVALILDGGACDVGIESTIVAFTDDEPVLLRPGGIAPTRSPACSDTRPRAPAARRRARPGRSRRTTRRARRRASSTRRALVGEAHAAAARRRARAHGRAPATSTERGSRRREDPPRYARDLYANLRALDAARRGTILIEEVPGDDAWTAVRDRLARATRGDDDDRDWD